MNNSQHCRSVSAQPSRCIETLLKAKPCCFLVLSQGFDLEVIMFAKSLKIAAAAALTVATLAPAAAEARGYHGGHGHGGYDRPYRGDYYGGRGGYYRGGYEGPRYYGGGNRGYRCDRGTGGTIIGAIAGGLLGNEIGKGRYNSGDGTTGAIVGAGVGALAGRAIDRNC
jgi:hypothetical protein